MASTSAFGWETPDDTDLVKDGAAAIRTLGNSIDTSMSELKGGTTGQVLSKTSATDMDFTWVAQDDSNAIQNAIVDAKGDLIAATANDTPARLGVGVDYSFLMALASESRGLTWQGGAWTTHTPTVISTAGSITTSSAAARYIRIGKFVFFTASVTITNNGTGSGILQVGLPFAASTASGAISTAIYRENAVTGSCGQVFTSGNNVLLSTFANSYPAVSGYNFLFGIGYEVA